MLLIRSIIAYKNYFIDFYRSQEPKVQEKIEFVLDTVRFERQVPKKFFKALENTDGIYEIRVITTFKSIRILCFLDTGNVVVLINCLVKKSQKTPGKEIKQAERIKKEYLKAKNS